MPTKADLKQVGQKSWAEFRADFVKDPVQEMVNAATLEMNLSQYGNFRSPETLITQKRSWTARLAEEEGLFFENSSICKAADTDEFLESPHRTGLMFDYLYRRYYGKRASITMEADGPVGGQLLPFGYAPRAAPVEIGLPLNPGELVASSHGIGTDNYKPFKWDFDKNDDQKNLRRFNVNPGATIPPSTLGHKEGIIQMEKWGNRFVLPYEDLTGSNAIQINKLGDLIRLEGMVEEGRMFEELIGVLENGDTTKNSAAEVITQADMGGTYTSSSDIEFVAFLNWLDEAMDYPFQISHVLWLKHEKRQIVQSMAALTGNLALEQLNSVGLAPRLENMEGPAGKVRYGKAPEGSLTAYHVLGVDARAAVEFVSRDGMAIRQQADSIKDETRQIVISDTYLWSKLATQAVKMLRVRSA